MNNMIKQRFIVRRNIDKEITKCRELAKNSECVPYYERDLVINTKPTFFYDEDDAEYNRQVHELLVEEDE